MAGSERIEATLRLARPTDVDLTFRWASDPEVRSQSYDSGPIAASEHRAWFESRLADPDHRYFVFELEGAAVGAVRFQRSDEGWIVSVVVDPAHRGRGLASRILAAAVRELRAEGASDPVVAWIKAANTASVRAFRAAGFEWEADVVEQGVPSHRYSCR